MPKDRSDRVELLGRWVPAETADGVADGAGKGLGWSRR